MRFDVNTLYLLIVGTTFVGAALTFWQRRILASHRRELGYWTAGHFLVGLGCLIRMGYGELPSFVSIGLSNLAVLVGYGCVTVGAMMFAERRPSPAFLTAAVAFTVGWIAWGQFAPTDTRIVVTALAVMALSLLAAGALANNELVSSGSRGLVRAMFVAHGVFFLGRAGVTLSGIEGEILFDGANFAATMAEGVLWSTFAPAALLMMVREATERRLVTDSETDFLTGVDNRRAFMTKAAKLLDEPDALVSVAVFDLDHFKTINDRHGHATGDEVLSAFCRMAESELSPGDVFGRLGGEEFAIAFRDCGAADAQRLAAAISKLYTAEIALRFQLSLRATVSAGVAEGQGPSVELAKLLGEADSALYQAKKSGRDQAVIAEARPRSSPTPASEPRAA